MEAIKQALKDGITTILIIFVMGLTIIAIVGLFSIDRNITTGEDFQVTSDTSEYTCIVSKIDNDLSLNCLKIK